LRCSFDDVRPAGKHDALQTVIGEVARMLAVIIDEGRKDISDFAE